MERRTKVIIGVSVVVVLVAIGIGGYLSFTSKVSSYEYPLPTNITGYNIEYDEEKEEFNVTLALTIENPYNFSVQDVLIKTTITGANEFEKSWKFSHLPKEVTSGEIAPINYSTKVDFAPEDINVYVYARK